MVFVRNAWYVAGWSSEFGNDLSAVKILDENIVIYRTSKGQVIAMEDRCPHRFLPPFNGQTYWGRHPMRISWNHI